MARIFLVLLLVVAPASLSMAQQEPTPSSVMTIEPPPAPPAPRQLTALEAAESVFGFRNTVDGIKLLCARHSPSEAHFTAKAAQDWFDDHAALVAGAERVISAQLAESERTTLLDKLRNENEQNIARITRNKTPKEIADWCTTEGPSQISGMKLSSGYAGNVLSEQGN